ncbi:putative F-box/FBD/LRR-repeat protein At4g03220 [Rhododendron vialii]|uniref:putative F-box/FBD/LRR-repeat protein At4g03220 n=1 Tax=Rhododendron vialii TaxID=182163 RepID=UPI00265DF5E0|nr:putative F-box/FBD/LRR-repeat protein At4g03220 [Rhododendron vialii]
MGKTILQEEADTTSINLPDEMLEHIFAYLPTKSLARTDVLSKHWNRLCLWRSHPHLIILDSVRDPLLSHKLTKLLRAVLSRRQPDSNITTFRLCSYLSPFCLRDCIDRVVMNHGIERLELDVYLDCSFDLPSSLFDCNTLRVLTLNHQYEEPVDDRRYFSLWEEGTPLPSYRHFNYPDSRGLPSVHALSLTNVYFRGGSDLFSGDNFPLLRKLWLKNCRGLSHLNINCPGLEILKLDGLHLKGLNISGTGLLALRIIKCFRYVGSWAKIWAPSLQSLYWESRISVKCSVKSFRDLKTCSLRFHYKIPDRATLQSASTLLSATCFARSMFVGSGNRVLETLSKIDSEGGLPCSFTNLVTLELHTYLTKDEIIGITCLLRSSPILRTMTIISNSCSGTRNMDLDEKQYWKSQIQNLKSIEVHLKVVRIDVQDVQMHERAVYLGKLLLCHGRALQEMTLNLRSYPVVPSFEQQRVQSEIMTFAHASSNVIVTLLPPHT